MRKKFSEWFSSKGDEFFFQLEDRIDFEESTSLPLAEQTTEALTSLSSLMSFSLSFFSFDVDVGFSFDPVLSEEINVMCFPNVSVDVHVTYHHLAFFRQF